MNPIAQARRWRLPLHAWLLASLLLLAQGLGLAHGMAHGLELGSQHPVVVAHAHDSAWDHDHEAGSAECRLVDQLGHADGLSGVWVLPVDVLVSAAAPAAAGQSTPRPTPAASYRARAPPR